MHSIEQRKFQSNGTIKHPSTSMGGWNRRPGNEITIFGIGGSTERSLYYLWGHFGLISPGFLNLVDELAYQFLLFLSPSSPGINFAGLPIHTAPPPPPPPPPPTLVWFRMFMGNCGLCRNVFFFGHRHIGVRISAPVISLTLALPSS